MSGLLELTAVCLFVFNPAWTMLQRVPVWFGPSGVASQMTVYFSISSFPKAKRVLIDSGLKTLERAKNLPYSLTLSEAATADGVILKTRSQRSGHFSRGRQPRRRNTA